MLSKKYFKFSIIHILFIFFWSSIPLQSQEGIFIKERPAEIEKYVVELLRDETSIANSEKRKLANAIVRFSKELKFTDSAKIGEEKIDELVFLTSLIKHFSKFQKFQTTGTSYGYMAVSESMIRETEKEFNAKIERTFDIYEPILNVKIGVRKLNGILAKAKSIKEAISEYANLSGRKFSYDTFENTYRGYIEKNQKAK